MRLADWQPWMLRSVRGVLRDAIDWRGVSQGLKPMAIRGDLRGPEAPLFHGALAMGVFGDTRIPCGILRYDVRREVIPWLVIRLPLRVVHS